MNSMETVTVPDLPRDALLAVVKEKVRLTALDSNYAKYDFIKGERGKRFEVAIWAPRRPTLTCDVRRYFRALGGSRPFVGNAPALLSWVAKNPGGWFVSIPDDDDCFVDGGDLYAPGFYHVGWQHGLVLFAMASGGWGDDFVFVAFREFLP